MGWARLDDAYSDHPKIALAGVMAELLDIRAILYACRFETDGLIPRAVLPIVGRGIPRTAAQAKKLVDVGRWVETVDGWEICDFLEYNPSRASNDVARAERHDAKVRAGRAGGIRSGEARRQANGKHGASPPHEAETKQNEAPSRPLTGNSSPPQLYQDPVENPAPIDETAGQTERSVLERIADSRLDAANGVRNRASYRTKILAQLPDEIDLERLRRIIESHPDAPIEMLASAALGENTPYLGQYRVEPAEVG